MNLIEHILKVVELITESLTSKTVTINYMEFLLKPKHSIQDAIFIIKQLQEKNIWENHNSAFAFVHWPLTGLLEIFLVDLMES